MHPSNSGQTLAQLFDWGAVTQQKIHDGVTNVSSLNGVRKRHMAAASKMIPGQAVGTSAISFMATDRRPIKMRDYAAIKS